MKSTFAFLKKEFMGNFRSGKIFLIVGLFLLFGLMNPATAWVTPMLYDLMAEALEASGIVVGEYTVRAFDSWLQFFSNIPMALIAFVLIYSGTFTSEYSSGTLVLILTKGLSRSKVLLAKAAMMLILWSLGYWISFAVTYFGTDLLWDNSIAEAIAPAGIFFWLFGVMIVCLCVFFSVVFKNYIGVLLGTGGSVCVMIILSIIPKVDRYIPFWLTNGMPILYGTEELSEYTWAVIIAVAICIVSILASIPVFNKKEI